MYSLCVLRNIIATIVGEKKEIVYKKGLIVYIIMYLF